MRRVEVEKREIISEAYKRRLTPLRPHPVQQKIIDDTFAIKHRFTITHSGRRSGKTELVGKRRFVARVVKGVPFPNPKYFVAAPTRDQVWRLYWDDLKLLTLPFRNPDKPPLESKLIIYLKGDREIHLLGMDKPERIEGSHWDGGVLDEYANMKPKTWPSHVRPALSTPGRGLAWCDFVGVPEGRNHYYNLVKEAEAQRIEFGEDSDWMTYHWISEDIVDPKEILQAKRDMDPLTYAQEYCGSFELFSGRAYYNFNSEIHCAKLSYDPKKNLIFCFDFNVDPGIAVIVQEQNLVDVKTMLPVVGTFCVGVIGEVYIPKNSNTIKVCNKLVEDWGGHLGKVLIYGDPAGGNRGSAQIRGSDWDLVREVLWPVYRDRLVFKVSRNHPPVRARINSVNSLMLNTLGEVRMQVDPIKAPHTVIDFEGVTLQEGSAGEIDKSNLELSHISDAIGYLTEREYPVRMRTQAVQNISGF